MMPVWAIGLLDVFVYFFSLHILQAWDTTSISLSAGCDLYMRYVTRTSALEYEDFNAAKSRLIERGEKFGEISLKVQSLVLVFGDAFSSILVACFSIFIMLTIRLVGLLQCLVRILYLMGVPFWFMVTLELSSKC